MPSVVVSLNIAEHEALQKLARRERRNLKGQAAIAIRRELERLGLLPADLLPAQAEREPKEAADEAQPPNPLTPRALALARLVELLDDWPDDSAAAPPTSPADPAPAQAETQPKEAQLHHSVGGTANDDHTAAPAAQMRPAQPPTAETRRTDKIQSRR